MDRPGFIRASEKESGKAVDLTPPDFTVDDIVEEIKRQLATTEEGMTNREITVARGLRPTTSNMGATYKKINDMIANGVMEYVGKKEVEVPTGGTRRIKAYALKKIANSHE